MLFKIFDQRFIWSHFMKIIPYFTFWWSLIDMRWGLRQFAVKLLFVRLFSWFLSLWTWSTFVIFNILIFVSFLLIFILFQQFLIFLKLIFVCISSILYDFLEPFLNISIVHVIDIIKFKRNWIFYRLTKLT